MSGRGALASLVLTLAAASPLLAKKDAAPPKLDSEHEHSSGAFTFRTPDSWRVEPVAGNPDAVQATGDGVAVRFIYKKGDIGYDTLHVDCMMQRLTGGPFDVSPQIKYEYDFLSGTVGDMRILDSAFVTVYDNPIEGEREWRQRNLTITGAGHSLCAISFAPLKAWKKSKQTQTLLDEVVKSVSFRRP